MPAYDTVKKGYANLWSRASLVPLRASAALAAAKTLLANKRRYETIAVQVGNIPWWFIAALHHLEARGSFNAYLGNGQTLSRTTTIVPVGRGPFKTFEAGALDALRLKGYDKITLWDMPRALYEAERYNGFGYWGKVNSPYLWSFTNLYTKGKYIRDHVYDANAVSQQIGVAAIFKAFEQLGVFEPEHIEDGMAELKASLLPFGGLVPTLITTLAGPAASLAIRALADAFDDDKPEAKPDAVQKRLEEVPLSQLPGILQTAEDVLNALLPPTPIAMPIHAAPLGQGVQGEQGIQGVPGPAGPAIIVPSTPTTVVVSPAKDDELGIVDTVFGGKYLAGLKTPAGILVYCLAWAASSLGYITPDVASALYALATALAGIGITAKIDKVLPWLATLTSIIRR